ncbi:MAG: family 43 glycosylhydrolase [Polyangiaceae bacterium]
MLLMNSRSVVASAFFLALLVPACSGTDAPVDDTGSSEDEATANGKSGPGFPGAYASPTIARDGSTYHAYFAKQSIDGKQFNVPHGTFTADGKWTLRGEALPKLGAQTKAGSVVWAPAVAKIDDTHWMLYYTADLAGTDQKKCIWRAHSSDAHGPFVDDYDGPIECLDGSLWAIDPYLVQDGQGDWMLGARLDLPGGINTIQVRKLGPLAQHFAVDSAWKMLTRNSPNSWEQPVLENAGLVHLAAPDGTKHWFVFYSGRSWDTDKYAVGYADCGLSIDGDDNGAGNPRCKKMTPNGPWLETDSSQKLFGPGTPTFYTDEAGDDLMSVQAWQHSGGKANKNNNGQIMQTFKIHIDNGFAPHVKLLRTDL